MRTIPTEVSDGFTNNYTPFWCVKVEPSTGDPFYWTTASKNRTGHTFTLKWDVSTTVTPDSGMIASRDRRTGEEWDGIGQMESGVDIYAGGGIARVSGIEIQILNQADFHDTVIQANINIENRPAAVYFGFIPDGSGQTVIVSTQMLKRWAGVVEEVMDYNYQVFSLRCVDGSFQRHKEIPTVIIETDTYPNAPKESLGKAVPFVYGVFYADETSERDFMTLTPVPAIQVNEITGGFILADHVIDTLGNVYVYCSENNIYGLLPAVDNSSNTSSGVTFDYAAGGAIVATFRQIPYVLDTTNTATNPENSVDGSANTHTHVGKDCGDLFRMVPRPQQVGTLVDSSGNTAARVKLRAYIGSVSDSEADKIFLMIGVASVYTITDADIDTVVEGTNSTDFTWDLFASTYFGVYDNSAVAMIVEVEHIVVEYYAVVANLMRPKAVILAPRRFGGRRV